MRQLRVSASTLVLALAAGTLLVAPLAAQEEVRSPRMILDGVPFTAIVYGVDDAAPYTVEDANGNVLSAGTLVPGDSMLVTGLLIRDGDLRPLTLTTGGTEYEVTAPFAPAWLSLAPPIIAIVLALLFKEVITALFAGLWFGGLMVAGYNPFSGLGRTMDTYIVPAVADGDHAAIIAFSLLLGGMVGIVARNGGTRGIVDAVTPFASSQRRGKLATWAAGLAIFFDDYANTLIVGNTMRPITDRLKISREKLAYIVDCTAAPVAAVVPISTWVGYEITLIGDGLRAAAGQPGIDPALATALGSASPFGVFLQTIPYLFYPLLAVSFVVLTSLMNRDFGPMARAEERASSGGGVYRPDAQLPMDTTDHVMDPKKGTEPKWYNAGVPVLATVLVVLGGLYLDGRAAVGPDASLMDIFGDANPFNALLWGSLTGCLVGILMSVGQGILTMKESLDAWVGGMKAMFAAMIILTLAWSIGSVTQDVGAADYLAQVLSGAIPLQLFPVLVFIVAAAMAFATGTSWTTMAILIPLVIPLVVSLGGGAGFEVGEHTILLGSISSVLAGAIFGDHCSPISDTTVLSSTAAACDHLDHVRTQMPYAIVVAVVGMLLGDIGTAYGLPEPVALLGGIGVLAAFLWFFGRKTSEAAPDIAEGAPAGG